VKEKGRKKKALPETEGIEKKEQIQA